MSDPISRLNTALDGRYRVEQEIARGGMGIVFLAQDLQHKRPVALKVVRPPLVEDGSADRFLREIRVTAQLRHPNILPLFDSGQADGLLYYVMPYAEGETLATRLDKGPLTIEETLSVTAPVCSALQYAHENGVVHRDIKPSNILFEGGEPVLADFGIALGLLQIGSERLTGAGVSLGTPEYMSPEQAAGEVVDSRSDQYAVACLVYHMLIGEPPFSGSNLAQIAALHLTAPVPPLHEARPEVSRAVGAVVARGLSKDPDDRYPSVSEFLKALIATAAADGTPTPGPLPSTWKAAAAALSVLVVVVTLAWGLSDDRGTLDPNRIVVFPLVTSGGSESTGEDLATSIGHALDGTASFRWIDGWTLLDDDKRLNPRLLSLGEARTLARDRGSAYFVSGRVSDRGESTEVFLDLYDVQGDSVVVGATASGPSETPWQVGLNAANGLLPALIGSSPEGFGRELFERRPEAVANFLLAERLFRRAQGTRAVEAYRRAFAADSTFAIAAMRGGRAATWEHDHGLAASLVEAALGLALSERDRLLAEGIAARLRGHADTSVFFFEAAIEADSSHAEAWLQLGETFRHVTPKRSNAAATIVSSMERALSLDPSATNALFHVIEDEVRQNTVGESPNLERFIAGEPQANLISGLTMAQRCVSGPGAVDLDSVARALPGTMVSAGNWLSTGGAQLPCAERIFRSMLVADSATDQAAEGRVSIALTGLHGVLVAQGRNEEALQILDSARVSTDALRRTVAGQVGWQGTTPPSWDRETRLRARHLTILHEMVGLPVGPRSLQIVREDSLEWGDGYRDAYADDLWRRAAWEAWRGNLEAAADLQRMLSDRAQTSTERVQSLAEVLDGHLALATGDSTEALRIFSRATPRAPQAQLSWHFAYPLGLERLWEAQLLHAAGRHREAIEVAGVLDGHPVIFLEFLRPSLELRAIAADAIGDARVADSYRQRLQDLGGN